MPKYFRFTFWEKIEKNSKIVNLQKTIMFLFCIMYKFHNTYFVILCIFFGIYTFYIFCIFIYFIYFVYFIKYGLSLVSYLYSAQFHSTVQFNSTILFCSTSPLRATHSCGGQRLRTRPIELKRRLELNRRIE